MNELEFTSNKSSTASRVREDSACSLNIFLKLANGTRFDFFPLVKLSMLMLFLPVFRFWVESPLCSSWLLAIALSSRVGMEEVQVLAEAVGGVVAPY